MRHRTYFTLHYRYYSTPEEILAVIVIYAVLGIFLGIATLVKMGIDSYQDYQLRKIEEKEKRLSDAINNFEQSLESCNGSIASLKDIYSSLLNNKILLQNKELQPNTIVSEVLDYNNLELCNILLTEKPNGFFRRVYLYLFGENSLETRYVSPVLAKAMLGASRYKELVGSSNNVNDLGDTEGDNDSSAFKYELTQSTQSSLIFSNSSAAPSAPSLLDILGDSSTIGESYYDGTDISLRERFNHM